MARLDVCLECFFTDLPYEQRVGKIAALGYDCLEFWHPEGTWDGEKIDGNQPKDAQTLRQACQAANVSVAGFVVNAWDGLYGGCPVNAEDKQKFLEQVDKMIDFAEVIGCNSGVIMAGVLVPGLTRSQMRSNMEEAFGAALEIATRRDFTLLVEPLNTEVDHAGFYLDSTAEAIELVRQYDSPRMKLLYDIYHMQIMDGNVVETIRQNVDILGHVHVAGVPGRAEPDACELSYPFIFEQAAALGYEGRFGLEYFPKLDPARSLARQLQMVH